MATLDMPLDDRIRNRTSNQRGRGQNRGRGRGRGSFRGRGGFVNQAPLGVNRRPSSYSIAKSFSRAKDMSWSHDLFNASMTAVGLSGVETGTKLYISNLDYRVSNEDIKELFSEIGDLKHCAVHYQRDGRPSGTAEVIFIRKSDALNALKRYNNVHLDGKPMKIEIIGANLGLPVTPRISVSGGGADRGRRTVVMTPELGRVRSVPPNRISGRGRGGLGRGRGRGRGRGNSLGQGGRGSNLGQGRGRGRGRQQRGVAKSAAELDKELDTYHAEAMNIS